MIRNAGSDNCLHSISVRAGKYRKSAERATPSYYSLCGASFLAIVGNTFQIATKYTHTGTETVLTLIMCTTLLFSTYFLINASHNPLNLISHSMNGWLFWKHYSRICWEIVFLPGRKGWQRGRAVVATWFSVCCPLPILLLSDPWSSTSLPLIP